MNLLTMHRRIDRNFADNRLRRKKLRYDWCGGRGKPLEPLFDSRQQRRWKKRKGAAA